jgi:pimeloyl-ACP methyl ester carboxylesterase
MALLFSCSKEEKNLTSLHYVSKEKKLTLTQTYINTFLQQFSNYPESSAIKNLVRNDVTIYKVKYRTKVKGEEISASALVCIPSVPGKYPVFSFQNGTNTRNSAAPTNDVLDPAFQMVEMISAMGYIVVIADYPGFGESSDIPHPYLVKEPTVQSLVDLLFTIKEMGGDLLDGVVPENRYYLLGYSQGGWATLALHKALETEYSGDFNLIGSVCGAGPYNIYEIFKTMTLEASYPQPVYLGYILNAYKWYDQFTNPLSDVVNPPYSERIPTLYNGEYTFGYINSQLSTSIPTLVNKDFIGGFISDPKYSQIRDALIRNSVQAWKTDKQLYLMHGGADDQVPPATTRNMYDDMIKAGTPQSKIRMEIFPGLDHTQGAVPIMIKGLLFLTELENS